MAMDEQKLQHWIDRLEIQDCVNRYARGLDRHDDDILRSVFHEDAVDNHGHWVGAREDFVQWANHVCHMSKAAHTHQLTTHNCEINGNEAHAETYVMFCLRDKEDNSVHIGGARYLDRLEKRYDEWRVVVRRVVLEWRINVDGSAWTETDGYERGTWNKTDPSYERPSVLPPDRAAKLKAS